MQNIQGSTHRRSNRSFRRPTRCIHPARTFPADILGGLWASGSDSGFGGVGSRVRFFFLVFSSSVSARAGASLRCLESFWCLVGEVPSSFMLRFRRARRSARSRASSSSSAAAASRLGQADAPQGTHAEHASPRIFNCSLVASSIARAHAHFPFAGHSSLESAKVRVQVLQQPDRDIFLLGF